MQPSPKKFVVRKRPNGVKKREDLIPCEDKNYGVDISHNCNKARKHTYLNLYIVGKLWIDLLCKALVGENVNITSAKETQTRQSLLKNNEIKPQLPRIQYQSSIIKYKDLPVYREQNIVEFDKEEKQNKFFADNIMRLHSFLLPHVSYCRAALQRSIGDVKSYVLSEFERKKNAMQETRKRFRENMRDPDKLPYRYTAAATGGVTGYLLGGSGGLPRRVLFTSLGLLSSGVVCFPKESDKVFKDVMYGAAKVCVYLYNTVTDEQLQLRKDSVEVPPPNANREIVKCPIK